MSVIELVIVILGSIIAIFGAFMLVVTTAWDIKQWRIRRRKAKEAPEPPTLHEVHAADIKHWDTRFYAVLDAALPGVCNCNPHPFSCPIHQSPPEKLRDLETIQWRNQYYREKQARQK